MPLLWQDRVYHFSGDEFCVVSQESDGDYVEDLLTRVDPSEEPTFSYGVARWPDAHESSNWEEVEGHAEERMRANKRERKERGEAQARPQGS